MEYSKDLSIIVPLLNEEESLPELLAWIRSVMNANGYEYEVLFIDDGSTDGSWAKIQELAKGDERIKGISFRRNYGKSAALYEGFAKAEGRVVVTMDADLQDSPEEIPEMYRMVTEEGYDVVSGWKQHRQDNKLTKNLPSKLYNATARWITGIKLHDMNCGLKAYKNEVVLVVDKNNEISDFTLYTLGLRDSKELSDMVSTILAGGEAPELEQMVFTYDDLLNLKFKVVLPGNLYKKNDDGTYTDMSSDADFLKSAVAGGLEVKVSAVIRASDKAYATTMQPGYIGYTSELANYIVSENEKTDVLKAQMDNPDTDIFTGMPFSDGKELTADDVDMDSVMQQLMASGQVTEDMQAQMASMTKDQLFDMLKGYGFFQESTSTYEDNMSKLGYAELAKPASINLYCAEFADKDEITDGEISMARLDESVLRILKMNAKYKLI